MDSAAEFCCQLERGHWGLHVHHGSLTDGPKMIPFAMSWWGNEAGQHIGPTDLISGRPILSSFWASIYKIPDFFAKMDAEAQSGGLDA